MMLKKIFVAALAVAVLGVAAPDSAQAKKKKGGAQSGPLDDGRIESSWFGGEHEWRETEEIDYFWVSQGFDLDGKSFHFVDWEEHQFLGDGADKRDENDHRMARQMTGEMADALARAFGQEFGNRASTSTGSGDIKVVGRIVDCSTGSTVAKALVGWGAGSGNTTIDVKFVEKSTGKVVAAMHHRVVSGTNWSTTDSKFFNWMGDAAEEIADKGFQRLYEKGDRAKD